MEQPDVKTAETLDHYKHLLHVYFVGQILRGTPIGEMTAASTIHRLALQLVEIATSTITITKR